MPIPESPREKFENNPLAEVGYEITISPLLELENQKPAGLQESIAEKYPYYSRGYVEGERGSDLLEVHDFISQDRFWKFSVSSRFVRLSTTDYEDRDQFRSRLEPLLTEFVQHYDRSRTLGSVLYYRDVLDRDVLDLVGYDWAELLNPVFAGELASKHVREEEVMDFQRKITLAADAIDGTAQIDHGLRSVDDEQTVYVFNTYLKNESEGTFAELMGDLEEYHDLGGHIFRWAISDVLHDALAGGDDEHSS